MHCEFLAMTCKKKLCEIGEKKLCEIEISTYSAIAIYRAKLISLLSNL